MFLLNLLRGLAPRFNCKSVFMVASTLSITVHKPVNLFNSWRVTPCPAAFALELEGLWRVTPITLFAIFIRTSARVKRRGGIGWLDS